MSSLPRVVIKPRRARPFFARHPWVFVTSIESVEGEPRPGDEVAVYSYEGQFIGRGLFNHRSAIRVRLYRWEDAPIDDEFLEGRLTQALSLRSGLLGFEGPKTACRLIFSESDGLSGLTVDRFDRWLVMQFTSLALYEKRGFLISKLVELTGAEGVMLRGEKGIPSQEGLKVEDGPVFGTPPEGPIEIIDNGLTYAVDLATGQKTGFFLDQRDNRRAVANYANGRRMLDLSATPVASLSTPCSTVEQPRPSASIARRGPSSSLARTPSPTTPAPPGSSRPTSLTPWKVSDLPARSSAWSSPTHPSSPATPRHSKTPSAPISGSTARRSTFSNRAEYS